MPRRKWSAEEKMSIVLEGMAPGANISAICRNHGIAMEKVREVIKPILEQNEMLKKELTELKERLAKVDEKTDALLARSEHQEKKWWRFWE